MRFVKRIKAKYGFITNVYCDSAEKVLIRGLKKALITANMGNIKIGDALKCKITDRIFTVTTLSASGRIYLQRTARVCRSNKHGCVGCEDNRSGAFGRWHE